LSQAIKAACSWRDMAAGAGLRADRVMQSSDAVLVRGCEVGS
jgi:hypothetical protein